MEVELRINGVIASLDVAANESLLSTLRKEGYFSVKHGCGTGDCGSCVVLVDGVPRPACVTFAAQVGGCTLTTVEGLRSARGLHPLQTAFADTGAVGCGFCTPGMLLSAYALLKRNPNPTEDDARDALSGHLCRCAGYSKAVSAILQAAAATRSVSGELENGTPASPEHETDASSIVGESARKINAVRLVSGKAAFADDIERRGMLHARLLTSPHAHAVIREIDVSEARALPGVHAVLTCHDLPRIPAPGLNEEAPRDRYSLDYIVRFVGDRVAAVAAETPEIAEQALQLIQVDYETLPTILDARKAVEPGVTRMHPETESSDIYDAARNIAAHHQYGTGNVEQGFAAADLVVEEEYSVPQWLSAPVENHTVITYLDEDDRLVVRSATEAPHTLRHVLAKLIDLPARRIRVIQPSVGGGFGAKHDLFLEDICALLTMTTQRPVRLEYTRAEEFRSSSTTEARVLHIKTGVRRDGSVLANSVHVLANAGAYAGYSSAALPGAGERWFSRYDCPNTRYVSDVIYTNLPPAGILQDSACTQDLFALESHIDEIARQLGMDALEFRRKNRNKNGSKRSSDSRSMEQCLSFVEKRLDWKEKRARGGTGRYRRGVGAAIIIQSIPEGGKSGAIIKLNEDGSFNVLVGTPDSGDGNHTILAQVAAEALGARVEDIIIELPDTDAAPFDSASATWYSCAGAVMRAAGHVRERILAVAGRMLKTEPGTLTLQAGEITALNGDSVTIAQVASHTLYATQEEPILAAAIDGADEDEEALPTFAAIGAEVEVDTETGMVRVSRVVAALDAGRVINPTLAEATVEGEITRALGRTLSEELCYDQRGVMLTTTLRDYHPFTAADMPPVEIHFLESSDGSGIYGARPYALCAGGLVAPAVANAVADALGLRARQLPLTPERLSRAIRAHAR
jgi:putative selenate reductase molybdopterin-binding subunit